MAVPTDPAGGRPFSLVVVSGKGGTGKTCVAASMLCLHPEALGVDADVEAPNLCLMLGAEYRECDLVRVLRPVVDPDRCDRCGLCARTCRFGALLCLGAGPVRVLEDLCHGCGLCARVCPRGAIREEPVPVGERRLAAAGRLSCLEGRLFLGEPNPIPVLEATLAAAESFGRPLVVDGPPGNACPLVATLRHGDFAVLVTEPTPFGVSDLESTLEVVQDLGIPAGILVNRAGMGSEDLTPTSERYQVPILGYLPYSDQVAQGYARGQLPLDADPRWEPVLAHIWQVARKEVTP